MSSLIDLATSHARANVSLHIERIWMIGRLGVARLPRSRRERA